MTTDSPVVVLFNSDGYEVNVKPGVAIPAGTTAILAAGSDGTNSRFILIDSSGRQIVVGAGTAGSPAGGVVTVQGDPAGTPIPISGSVSVANASVGLNGSAIPTSSTQIGASDGTNLQVPRLYDLDTGGGTQYNLGVNLRLSANGGSVEFGTNTNPIRIDPTGTTTQPISAVSLPLPTGAATEATLAGVLTTTDFQARINTLGQKTMANSTPVVIASDQSAITITGTVAGTGNFTVVQSTASNLRAQTASESATGAAPPPSASLAGGSVTTAAPAYTNGQMSALSLTTTGLLRIDGSGVTQPISAASLPLPTGAATEATLAGVLTTTAFQARINTLGQKTMANSTPVVLASDQTAILVSQSGTWTVQPGNTANTTPWLTSISQGGNTAVVKAASTAAVAADPALVVAVSPNNTSFTRDREFATFTALATGIALGNNKSMFSIQNANGSAVRCRIHEIYLVNVQTSNVTGVVVNFELRRATSHSSGTQITAIERMETTDTLDSSITVRTNATITSESATLLWRNLWSSDDWGTGGADVESNAHDFQTMFPIYSRKTQGLKPIILNANETLTIKCATNTTAGTFDLMVVFTQE